MVESKGEDALQEARNDLTCIKKRLSVQQLRQESVLIKSVIDAKQEIDVMIVDVPNAFVQRPVPLSNEIIILKKEEYWQIFYQK